MPKSSKKSVSRRKLLRSGAAAAAAGGFALAPQVAHRAGSRTGNRARRPDVRFRAFLRYGTGTSVEDLKLNQPGDRDVVVRTEASGVCYTITAGVLSTNNVRRPSVPNHSGMGTVEWVGPMVKRCQVGDRVIVPGTPQCGQCYQCLNGRSDWCQFLTTDSRPLAQMADGTEVFDQADLGGLSEIMVVPEEYCCPVFTDLPGEQLTMLGDTIGTGLAAARNLAPVWPGADVVVLGAGPVGMGAVQSAKVANAGQVIVIEPVKYRRDIAMEVGATLTIDPNAEKDVVARVKELTKGKTTRRFAGGKFPGFGVPEGTDFTIEATASDNFPPKVEPSPDPTGIIGLNWAFEFTRAGGHITTLGFSAQGTVSFRAAQFQNRGRTWHSGQQGGLDMLRDLPIYVALTEKGVINLEKMVTKTYPLDDTRKAVQEVADRTVLGAVIKFDS